MSGWVKAHGASQTIKIGMLWSTWSNGSRSSTTADTFTLTNASSTLVAGVYYDFSLVQQFYGESNMGALTAVAPAVYSMGGSSFTPGAVPSPLAVTFASASQTEPITGINNTADYPVVSFCPSITNSVSDTVETLQLTQFQLEL